VKRQYTQAGGGGGGGEGIFRWLYSFVALCMGCLKRIHKYEQRFTGTEAYSFHLIHKITKLAPDIMKWQYSAPLENAPFARWDLWFVVGAPTGVITFTTTSLTNSVSAPVCWQFNIQIKQIHVISSFSRGSIHWLIKHLS